MSWIDDLLAEYPTLTVARERLDDIDRQLRHLEAENRQLKKEKAEWLKPAAANSEVAFIPYHGVLWKRAEGTVCSTAYCPQCKLALAALPPGTDEMLVCAKCSFTAPFQPSQAAAFAQQLEEDSVTT